MTSPLPDRVAAWFTRITDFIDRQRGRDARVSAAGPVLLRHSYQVGTSHQDLCDALLGVPQPSAGLSIRSLEDPPPHLMSPPPVHPEELAGRVFPAALAGSRWRLTWNAAEGVVACLDRVSGHGVSVTAGPVRTWERGAPFRSFLHWRAVADGGALVHAGTIGSRHRMGLIVGAGGTGKSTTVLIGLDSGLATCGDDYVWLAPRAGRIRVHSVYGTLKTKRDSPWFPTGHADYPAPLTEADKTIHWLARRSPDSFLPHATVHAAVVLTDPAEVGAVPRALVTAAPSTAFQLPYDMPATLSLLRRTLDDVARVVIPRDGDPRTVRDALLGALGERDDHPVKESV